MKFPFQDIIVGRILPEILSFCRNFAEAARSGAIRRSFRLWLSANWLFATISLVVAALLYFRIRDNFTHSGYRSVPVSVVVEGSGKFTSVAVSPRAITVYVRGTDSDVRKFEASTADIRLAIPNDVMAANHGNVKLNVRARKDVPGIRELGLVVTSLSSDSVTVTYDSMGDVQFDIDPPTLVGRAYHADATVEISPMSASLHGGQNLLESLKDTLRLQVKPIEIENVSQGFERDCEIIVPEDLRKSDVTVDPRTVHATVKIVPRSGTRTFDTIPIRLSVPPGTHLPPDCEVWPPSVAAKISGYDLSVAALSNSMINAFAEIDSPSALDYSPSATNTLKVRLEFPPDKEIWHAEPDPAEVVIVMPEAPPVPEPEATAAPEVSGTVKAEAAEAGGEAAPEAAGDMEVPAKENDAKPDNTAMPELEKKEIIKVPETGNEKQQE